ncbi:hypothetical protein GJ496_008037 [Pomphorhynchus laevis]|nr:hypothetical protein GJ496_008037 [Pomphorhynchus laevis]
MGSKRKLTENPKDDLIQSDESKFGGAYIPRAKLRLLQQPLDPNDNSSPRFQRASWDELKKSINGIVNKANTSNIVFVARDLFRENIIRGRGLLVKCCMKAQDSSQAFTHVFAALCAIVNTKFPQIGDLLLRRLTDQFKKAFRRNDKATCISVTKFLAHLFNQNVVHEIIILEILTLLLNRPTNDSVEVAISIVKETGTKLTEVCPKGLNAIFDTLRNVLHQGGESIDRRVQYMIEVLFAIRKDGFNDFPAITPELDAVEESDQYTHTITLEENSDPETMLDVFRFDPDYQLNDEKYKLISNEILGGSEDELSDEDDEDGDENEEEEKPEENIIVDSTETNLVALRRTIYLTIQSSVNYEECAHKLMRLELKPTQQAELCQMILDSCAQLRTYERFFGLLAERFCSVDQVYLENFEKIFQEQYEIVHRLETVKLRNIAKFFSHLFCTDAISWGVLSCVRMTEDQTTSSSRVFIKNLFLEMAEHLGVQMLNQRFQDSTMKEFYEGVFPVDDLRNTRFSINFFTSIGLGGLTEQLREHLKTTNEQQKLTSIQ